MSVTHQMTATHQRIFLWLFIAASFLSLISITLFAKVLPPISGNASVAEIVALYQTDAWLKRLGFMLMMMAGGFYFGFSAVISVQMRRIEGATARILTYTQLSSGACNGLLLLLPSIIFTATAFRPERSPEVTVALHDLATVILVQPVTPFMLQQLAIAFAIFADKSPRPVFPRWVGHVSLWIAILYLPGNMMSLTRTGPFASDGLLALWLPGMTYLVWLIIMLPMLFRAIRQEAEEASSRDQ